MVKIGPHILENNLILAPMAGVTDLPFRQLCRQLGAGMAVSEMLIADDKFWNTRKSRHRLNHTGETEPRSVQIAGSDPEMMAKAAKLNEQRGAQIIDINMGCPAKKVCNKAAGSALMRDEKLVAEILKAVVSAVSIPVTLKMRTGWSPEHKNAILIAKLAEDIGVQALAIHGRTRACGYTGDAEYDTIAQVKHSVGIPIFANGDIDTPEKAQKVLTYTGADGLLIGRAAQGNPWIFREIHQYLTTRQIIEKPSLQERAITLLQHISALHAFYGDIAGVRIARKHTGWYLKAQPGNDVFRKQFNQLDTTDSQLDCIKKYFKHLENQEDIAA